MKEEMMTTRKKIYVSEKWTNEERATLREILRVEIEDCRSKLRAAEKAYDSPAKTERLNRMPFKIRELEDLIRHLEPQVCEVFLERNRTNFSDYITPS